MIRIIEFSPKPSEATSYYRSRGPFARLQKEHPDIEVIQLSYSSMFEPEINWADLVAGDILFLSRPAQPEMAEVVKLANKMNLPVWVDYDDLLLNVPDWNRTKKYYSMPEVRGSIEQILNMAQVVTVTTPMLKRRLSVYNDNIHIIPNAVDDYQFSEPVEYSDNQMVIWRGGDTHLMDLYTHKDSINKMMANHPEFEFIFLGYDAPFLDKAPKKSVLDYFDIHSYFKFLRTANASYNIIPLETNDFNIAKSNISWLETHWAGGTSIAPKFDSNEDVYDEACQYMYNPWPEGLQLDKSFDALVKISGAKKKRIWEEGVEVIREKYLLSITNAARYELIKDIMIQYR